LPDRLTSLTLDRSPRRMRTLEIGTPKWAARAAASSWLARPFSAAAATSTLYSRGPSLSTPGLLERGCTRTVRTRVPESPSLSEREEGASRRAGFVLFFPRLPSSGVKVEFSQKENSALLTNCRAYRAREPTKKESMNTIASATITGLMSTPPSLCGGTNRRTGRSTGSVRRYKTSITG
jgi:hypothetical protein